MLSIIEECAPMRKGRELISFRMGEFEIKFGASH